MITCFVSSSTRLHILEKASPFVIDEDVVNLALAWYFQVVISMLF